MKKKKCIILFVLSTIENDFTQVLILPLFTAKYSVNKISQEILDGSVSDER